MWLLLTIVVYFLARKIATWIRHPLCNPIFLCLIVLMTSLTMTDTSYAEYFHENQILHALLGPAVVAMAYPVYEQLGTIRRYWKVIFTACLSGSILSIFIGAGLALIGSDDLVIMASVLPKSISTPFALSVSEHIGGVASITSALVIVAGLVGAILGYPLMNFLKVKSPLARGLAIGAVSHAIGTAKASEQDYREGAMSSLALVLCGVITSLLAPLFFALFTWFATTPM
ncbi:CidB/LrgB family autolysis modulator [Veronia nyctiphanis]|uniref:CidB/LrgB family autolysis modulator n=1 Tax=Veronia nyctiphanis TaxID=1278244 RepID=A0A4Q0YSK8_9GAMM|nr:LrgB family protein [Veronia nyctiphanis]RXJ74220.1 CidB/LrgB family autolysis modulator [Veronia nyctiphanis]